MKLIIFGATGLVGSSVLREALAARTITDVLAIGRHTCGVKHGKLREVLLDDLFEVNAVKEVEGYDACIWGIGVSAVGLDEKEYARITEHLTMAWARRLLELNPVFSFCYCSAGGAGGRMMWARVRQRTEQGLKSLPFLFSGAVRPGFIRPGDGLRSRTRGYQLGITLMRPLFPLYPMLIRMFPFLFTSSEILGRAMLRVVSQQSPSYILESVEINRVGFSSFS